MKNVLIFLLSLLSLTANAQGIQKIKRVKDGVVQRGTAIRDLSVYPRGSDGNKAFLDAINAQAISITLNSGVIIPALGSGLVGPSWASLMYSMNGQELYVEGSGSELAKLRFQRTDGTRITGTNPNGVNLDDQTFYAFGDNSSANPSYPKQWRVTFTPSIIGQNFRITAQKSDGTLFAKEYVPAAGANRVQLYVASSSGNNGPPTSTTTTTTVGPILVEAENANIGNNRTVFADDAGSGGKLVCCYSSGADYVDYTVVSPGAGTLTVELRYQTNSGNQATGTISIGGTSKPITLQGLGGGKAVVSVQLLFASGSNTVRVAGNSGSFIQDRISVSGTISGTTTGGSGGGSGDGNTTQPPSYTGSAPLLAGGFAEGSLDQLYQLAPFVPSTNQVNAWTDNTEKVLQNSAITFAIHKSISGSVTKVIDRRNGVNTINTNALGALPTEPHKWDTGRSMDFTPYGTPKGGGFHYYWPSENDRQQSTDGDDVGYNPVNGGDNRLNRSGVEWYERRDVAGFGTVDYVRTTGLQWNMDNVRGQITRHAYYWLEGSTVRFMYILDNFRTDTQAKHELRLQEGPFIYTAAPLHNYLVDFGSGTVRVDKPDQPRDQNNQWDTGPQFTARNYIGAYADNGYGITLFTPYNSRFVGKSVLSFYGDEYSNASSYINASPLHDFDTPATTAFAGYLHVGTNAEFQSWQASANVQTQPFKFDFSGGRFQGWGSLNGTTTRQNGEVVWGIGDIQPYGNERGQSKFISPSGSWQASSMNKIYVNMALTGTTRISISFIKPGQKEGEILPAGQFKRFTVTPTGSYQTYEFDMTGTPGWSGTIANIAIEPPYDERSGVQANDKAKMGWINTVNQKP